MLVLTLPLLLILLTANLLTRATPRQAALLASSTTLQTKLPPGLDLLQTSIEELGLFLSNSSLTSINLVAAYLSNIERDNHRGLNLRAVIQTAPADQVLTIAAELDREREKGRLRGPLHGIPLLVKDNIATAVELGMNTSAGNFALQQSKVKRDAEVIRKLRDAGAIIIAKTNLNEFAGFKGILEAHDDASKQHIHNGWSAVGGQTSSAYVEGGFEAGGNPEGSSSGSAVGVSAGFGAGALGTDTTGSVIGPANRAALFGIRPTTGLVFTDGVLPISADLDTVGPMAFTTRDAAIMLDAMTFSDGRFFNATLPSSPFSYHSKTTPLKLGLVRNNFLDEADGRWTTAKTCVEDVELALKSTVRMMGDRPGVEVLDVNMDMAYVDLQAFDTANTEVMVSSVREDMGAYLQDLQESPVRTLRDIIEWNEAHASIELPPAECCQQRLIDGLISAGRASAAYENARRTMLDVDEKRAMGYLFNKYNVDALVFSPDLGLATSMAAARGYAEGTAPMGYCESNGAPFGILFVVRPGEDEKLLAILAAYEGMMPKRRTPGPMVKASKGMS